MNRQSEYINYLLDLLSSLGGVTAKKMFGGYGIYRDAVIFGIVVEDTLYFKVGDLNRADYQAVGSAPFTYEAKGKRVAMSYWQVPSDILDDEDLIRVWAEKSCAVSRQSKVLRKKKS